MVIMEAWAVSAHQTSEATVSRKRLVKKCGLIFIVHSNSQTQPDYNNDTQTHLCAFNVFTE